MTKDGEVSKHAWEFTLLHEARAALRAGDLTVEGSQRYSAWDSDLYQADTWAQRRDAWYAERGLPRDGEVFLSSNVAAHVFLRRWNHLLFRGHSVWHGCL